MSNEIKLTDESLFYSSFYYAPIGICLVIPGGPWIKVNPAFCKMIGYTEEEILSMRFLDFTHPEDRTVHEEDRRKLLDGEIDNYSLEKRYIHKAGHTVWTILNVSLFRNASNEPMYFIVQIQDITERKRAEEKLKRSEASLDTAQRMAYLGNWEWDMSTDFIFCSEGLQYILRVEENELNSYEAFLKYVHSDDRNLVEQFVAGALEGDLRPIEFRMLRSDGEERFVHGLANVFFDDRGKATRMVFTIQDITNRKRAEEKLHEANQKLKRLSNLDGLTGVPNRRYFDEILEKEWKRESRFATNPISLIMIDIDFFKEYNDTYGHLAGDDCICKVAQTIQGTLRRPFDVVARFGGEEFAVILPKTNLDGAICVAEKLRTSVESLGIRHIRSNIAKVVTISLGVASMVPKAFCSPKELILLSDSSLYQAKLKARNCVSVSQIT